MMFFKVAVRPKGKNCSRFVEKTNIYNVST